jgi:hypothetical protein
MAIYTVRTLKGGRTLLRKQVSEGQSRDAVLLQAQAEVSYVFSDVLTNTGPAKINAKRVGQNLHLALNKGNPDTPDVIIESYFDFPPAPVVGSLAEGGQAVYDLGALGTQPAETASVSAISSPTAASTSSVQASLPGNNWENLGWIGAGLLGLAAVGGGKSGGDSVTAATIDPATTAQSKINAYAGDGSQPAPTVEDYASAGIRGVSSSNQAAINSAVDALVSSNVDDKGKLQTVVDAYAKILAEANGANADATPGSNPLVSDYAAIGASIGLAGSNAAALSLLNEVVGNLTSTAVDTIAEINALAAVVDKIMNAAAGKPAALTIADYALLGLPTSGSGAVTAVNLAAVNNAIATAGGQAKVDTYAELSGLVTAVSTIVSYADDSSQAVPTLAQYTSVGISGITSSNLGAINSAIDANAASGVDTKAELQSIVDTYAVILAEANGAAVDATPGANPAAAQYALIGANIGAAANSASNLSLLDDALAGLSSTAVDTVAEINDLAAAANAVIASATGTTAPSLAQLITLGITGVTVNNLVAVQNDIALTADSGLQVDTMAELQALVTGTVNAAANSQNRIQNYATSSANPAPSLLDYLSIGVTGVDGSKLAAINSAVDALSSNGVDTPFDVQGVVDAYSGILAEANGTAADASPGLNPGANDYVAIGASIGLASGGIATGNDLASAALALLDNAVAGLTTTQVDSVAEINALANAVDKVVNLAKLPIGSAVPAGTLSMADLALLGVNTTLADSPAEINTILQAIIDSVDSGSGVNTILALQAIVNAHTT